MGTDRWFEIECFHSVSDPELKKIKPDLNLFHPTASPSLGESSFFWLRPSLTETGFVILGEDFF